MGGAVAPGAQRCWCTHTDEVAEVLSSEDWCSPPSSPSCGIFGELGAEESGVAISSMSEYVLEPFLMLNALLKELLSCREKAATAFIQLLTRKIIFITPTLTEEL